MWLANSERGINRRQVQPVMTLHILDCYRKKKNTQITDIPKKTDVISKVHGEIYGT